MDAGDTEQEDVGADRLGGLGRGGAAGDRGVPEQAAAQQEHVDPVVVQQRGGDGRAVRHDGRLEVPGQRLRDGEGGGPAVEDDGRTGPDQPGGEGGHPVLAAGRDGGPARVVGDRGGDGQRPAVDPLAEPGRGEVAQVTADAVFGDAHLGRDVLRQHLALGGQAAEQQFPSFADQHARSSLFLPSRAHYGRGMTTSTSVPGIDVPDHRGRTGLDRAGRDLDRQPAGARRRRRAAGGRVARAAPHHVRLRAR